MGGSVGLKATFPDYSVLFLPQPTASRKRILWTNPSVRTTVVTSPHQDISSRRAEMVSVSQALSTVLGILGDS